MTDIAHGERERFFRAAKLMAGLTVISRVLGMVRAMSIAWLGASRMTDAFQMAFAVPNLFRRLFGEGALSGAFVPVLTETAEKGGFDKARRLFANTLGILASFLTGLLAVILIGLFVWSRLKPGQPDRQLLVTLVAIMLPYMVLVCLLALGSAALNCREHFAYPAFAPILLNVFMIAAVLCVAPLAKGNLPGQLMIIAVSVILAGIVQLAGVLWWARRSGFTARPTLRPVQPGVKTILRLMAPMLLGLGFLQLTGFFDYLVGWTFAATKDSKTIWVLGHELARPLDSGVLVRLNVANTLYQFPMGVLALSLGVAVFPLLSRYAARGDMPNLRDSLNRALRLAIMEGLATGVGLLVLAGPIITLIFEHGQFSRNDTREAGHILRFYAAGLWAFCSYPIFMRAFYSLKEPAKPLKVSCVLAVVYMAAVLGLIWVPWVSAAAFSLAAASTFSLNVIILSLLLRKRLGRLGGRKLAVSIMRSALAAAVMGASVLALRRQLGAAPNWLVVGTCVPAGGVVFVLVVWLLRGPELRELRGRPAERAEQPGADNYNGGPVSGPEK
ncbi:MAG TPA: murein biosynthesis integral membrane protein MurJ [Phycisphaerae bacterium]|nr:murein biosynthesis integral membrane protein MurJ [Phycisphaerae bacterium]